MNITFIGYGNVGAPLAGHLQHLGHTGTLAARDLKSDAVRKAQARNAALKAVMPKPAVLEADVVFLATPFAADELNPLELGVIAPHFARVPQGRHVVVPAGPATEAHRTQVKASVWADLVGAFLRGLPPMR